MIIENVFFYVRVYIVIYSWEISGCTNAPPMPIHDLPCHNFCENGQYLGLNGTKYQCLDCPENTYSEGSSLRFSKMDLNWNKIKEHTQMNCGWGNSIFFSYYVKK